MKTSRKKIISGLLIHTSSGEANDLLGVLPTSGDDAYRAVVFAEHANDIISYGRKNITVRYYISDTQASIADLSDDLAKVLMGLGQSKFGAHYSEITGYLWTDEDLVVGGHDIVAELKSSIGKWLVMEINIHN